MSICWRRFFWRRICSAVGSSCISEASGAPVWPRDYVESTYTFSQFFLVDMLRLFDLPRWPSRLSYMTFRRGCRFPSRSQKPFSHTSAPTLHTLSALDRSQLSLASRPQSRRCRSLCLRHPASSALNCAASMAGGAIAATGTGRASQYQGKTTAAVVRPPAGALLLPSLCIHVPTVSVPAQVMIAIVAASGGLLFG